MHLGASAPCIRMAAGTAETSTSAPARAPAVMAGLLGFPTVPTVNHHQPLIQRLRALLHTAPLTQDQFADVCAAIRALGGNP